MREREKTNLALVGKGRWGQNYITTIAQLEGVGLSPEDVKTRDYRELFSHPEVQGVIIASPSDTHFKVARDFIEKDISVLIEKPITSNYEEAAELQRLHRQHENALVMAGHLIIYDPGYQELKKKVNMVGKIQKMVFQGLQSPVRSDSTVLENWGPHPVYLFVDLIGRNPDTVSANSTTNDNVHLGFDFGNNVLGVADIGSIAKDKKRELSVVGSDGSLTLDWSGVTKTLVFRGPDGLKNNLDLPGGQSPLALETLEFVECIKSGKQPKTPLSQGVDVMRILDSAQKSISLKSSVLLQKYS